MWNKIKDQISGAKTGIFPSQGLKILLWERAMQRHSFCIFRHSPASSPCLAQDICSYQPVLTYLARCDCGFHLPSSTVLPLVPTWTAHLICWLDTLIMGNDRRLSPTELGWGWSRQENFTFEGLVFTSAKHRLCTQERLMGCYDMMVSLVSTPGFWQRASAALVVQWLRLQAPNAKGLGLIHGHGTRSHMPQLKIPHGTIELEDPPCHN